MDREELRRHLLAGLLGTLIAIVICGFIYMAVAWGQPNPQDDKVWMPAFQKWLQEQKHIDDKTEPPRWEAPCICSCANEVEWDKCCSEWKGPVAQSGEPPPCKRQTPGRNRSGPPKS